MPPGAGHLVPAAVAGAVRRSTPGTPRKAAVSAATARARMVMSNPSVVQREHRATLRTPLRGGYRCVSARSGPLLQPWEGLLTDLMVSVDAPGLPARRLALMEGR